MSMEIKGSYHQSPTSYVQESKAEQMKEQQALAGDRNAKETEEGRGSAKASGKAPDRIFAPCDAYVSSEKAGEKPSGLYRVGQDGNGNRKIYFDNPEKSGKADGSGVVKVNAGNQDNDTEECTVNTDKVDREIEQLREKKRSLEQQIKAASGDEKKTKELENKLAEAESELKQKDNDAYRRQNASVSA